MDYRNFFNKKVKINIDDFINKLYSVFRIPPTCRSNFAEIYEYSFRLKSLSVDKY